MNILIVSFFIFNVLVTAILGVKFIKHGTNTFKTFGISLFVNAIAFAMWSFGVIQPENLLMFVTLGTIAFLISLVFLFYTPIQNLNTLVSRNLSISFIVLILIGVFLVGNQDPSYAYISPEGFLFFNLGSLMQMLYIFILAFAMFPAIDLVASKFKPTYSTIFRYGFIAQTCGGFMLMTTKDSQVLYVTGWIIVIIYLLLLSTFVFNKKAWIN